MSIEIIVIYTHITTWIGIVGRVDDAKKIRPKSKNTKEKNPHRTGSKPTDESASFLVSWSPYSPEQARDPYNRENQYYEPKTPIDQTLEEIFDIVRIDTKYIHKKSSLIRVEYNIR